MPMEYVLQDPEFIPYVRRWLFESLAAGTVTPDRAVAVARRVGVELEAGGYAVVLFDLPVRAREAGAFADPADAVREALLAYFLKYSEYMPAELSPNMGAVLVKGGADDIPALTDRCVGRVREEYDRGGVADWHLAASSPTAKLEDLPACYKQASRLWALGTLLPGRQVLLPGAEGLLDLAEQPETLPDADPERMDPEVIRAFLESGRGEDAADFARRYLQERPEVARSDALRDYVLLSALFAAERFLEGLGLSRERYTKRLGPWRDRRGEPARFLEQALCAAIELRDQAAGAVRSGTLGAALDYVDSRFTDPELTLARAAEQAGVTASYLSALFRKELGMTFTQAVTGRRMELARRLLRTTDRRPGQIAHAVGFRDSHYFNALFKKTQGCTPSQFRAGAK